MVKVSVYYTSLFLSSITISFSIASLLSSNWIKTTLSTPLSISTTYGLFKKCDSDPYQVGIWNCRKYPKRRRDCSLEKWEIEGLMSSSSSSLDSNSEVVDHDENLKSVDIMELKRKKPKGGKDWGFCDKWITAGYLALLSLVLSSASLLSILSVLISGSRAKRESGWKLIVFWNALATITSIASFSIIVEQYRDDWRFNLVGESNLGSGMIFNIVSWIIGVTGIIYWQRSEKMKEDDYQPISDA